MNSGGAAWSIITIAGPILLLVAFLWVVTRRNSSRSTQHTEDKTEDLYAEEERRRRAGTDDN
mgnify:CR=1 FL=1